MTGKPGPIVLLTDFGIAGHYAGVMHGVIHSINPDAKVIDLCHSINPQDISQGAFILERTFRYFPAGSIFVCVVDPGVGGKRRAIAAGAGGYFFVAPDNGLIFPALSLLAPREACEISNPDFMLHNVSSTFHGRDIFSPAAAHLSRGTPISSLGPPLNGGIVPLNFAGTETGAGFVRGRVIFADPFGNLITGIGQELYEGKGICRIRAGSREIGRLSESYSQAAPGELLAITGSLGTLEIAVNCGSAAETLGQWKDLPVEIEFLS
jgi:hypothetical protein